MPKTMGELLLTQDIEADVFVNPETKNKPPAGKNKEELAVWINTSSDYVYMGAGKRSSADAETIFAHEKILPNSRGVNLLFADGHVEFMSVPDAKRRIEEQTKKNQAQ
jgi:prepilin-type processing-associated H-X9-DG protein